MMGCVRFPCLPPMSVGHVLPQNWVRALPCSRSTTAILLEHGCNVLQFPEINSFAASLDRVGHFRWTGCQKHINQRPSRRRTVVIQL